MLIVELKSNDDIKSLCTGQKTFIDEANLYSFPFPDPHDERLFEGIDENLARHSDRYAFFDLSATMFERAFSLRGFQQVLEDMYLNPEFLHKLFDRILEFDLACLEKGLAYPVDGVRFGDDWGTQNGLLMSPASWREFLKPRMKILIERCRKAGKTVMLHSCGNITDIIPDLIEIGLTIYETFQPEAMDVRKIKEEYGKDLSFWGGVSMQKVLAYGTPEEVVAEIEQKCELLGKDGGYICGPSHTVTVDVPLKNTLAMMQTLKNQKSR